MEYEACSESKCISEIIGRSQPSVIRQKKNKKRDFLWSSNSKRHLMLTCLCIKTQQKHVTIAQNLTLLLHKKYLYLRKLFISNSQNILASKSKFISCRKSIFHTPNPRYHPSKSKNRITPRRSDTAKNKARLNQHYLFTSTTYFPIREQTQHKATEMKLIRSERLKRAAFMVRLRFWPAGDGSKIAKIFKCPPCEIQTNRNNNGRTKCWSCAGVSAKEAGKVWGW